MRDIYIKKHELGVFIIMDGKAVALFPYMQTELSIKDIVIVYQAKMYLFNSEEAKRVSGLLSLNDLIPNLTIGNSGVCEELIRYYNSPPSISDENFIEAEFSSGKNGLILRNKFTDRRELAHFDRRRSVVRLTRQQCVALGDPSGNYSAVALLNKGYYAFNPKGTAYTPQDKVPLVIETPPSNANNTLADSKAVALPDDHPLIQTLNWAATRKQELKDCIETLEVLERTLREQIKNLI